MGKRTLRLSPLLFIVFLGLVLSSLHIGDPIGFDRTERTPIGRAWAQSTEAETQDSHYIQLMKQLRVKVDGWLKDLNQRIESEDVTRFEVRFLEILRSFLEWLREKIDAQIESGEKQPKKRIRREDL